MCTVAKSICQYRNSNPSSAFQDIGSKVCLEMSPVLAAGPAPHKVSSGLQSGPEVSSPLILQSCPNKGDHLGCCYLVKAAQTTCNCLWLAHMCWHSTGCVLPQLAHRCSQATLLAAAAMSWGQAVSRLHTGSTQTHPPVHGRCG
jgi:hypothetical protein